jgi:hypothetical protein
MSKHEKEMSDAPQRFQLCRYSSKFCCRRAILRPDVGIGEVTSLRQILVRRRGDNGAGVEARAELVDDWHLEYAGRVVVAEALTLYAHETLQEGRA